MRNVTGNGRIQLLPFPSILRRFDIVARYAIHTSDQKRLSGYATNAISALTAVDALSVVLQVCVPHLPLVSVITDMLLTRYFGRVLLCRMHALGEG